MKLRKFLLPLVTATTALLAVTGCTQSVKVGGEATIQIKSYKAGYGTDFLHEMISKYQEAHPEISFEIVEESALLDGEKTAAEIAIPKKNQIDLYFITGLDVNYLVKRSSSILNKRDVTLLEPLDDIFEGKAVGLDGKEEEETIKSRFFGGFEELIRYEGEFPKWRGTIFTLPWADASTGLFVNKKVLDKYNVEIPLTSNEFTAAVQTIYSNGASQDNYPFSWGGANAAGYWQYLYETWFAQYTGVEQFNNFMNCDPGNGKIVEEGYKVYEDVGILKTLEAMFDILDLNYSPKGSRSKTHMEAQTEFFTGRTAFMIDGDWILNEMKRDYYEYGKDIIMIGAPILSSIGEEIGITDAQLHDLVVMIDEHKTNAEIKAVISSLTDEQIARVVAARSVHDTVGAGHQIVIPSYADAKEAAKDFVRFFYSNDGCRIFRNFANANLPLSYKIEDGDTNTPFQQSLDKIRNYDNPTIVTSVASFNGVRSTPTPPLYTFNYSAWATPYTFMYIMIDKASSNPAFTPEKIFTEEKNYVKNKWSQYMVYIDYL